MRKPTQSDGLPKANEAITAHEVRLIDSDGSQVGVVSLDEALKRAQQQGMDLVEISSNVTPPVCKVIDYGKFKYEIQKKKSDSRKKQKQVQIKELKLRPTIDIHDYEVKLRNMLRFLQEGNKVKIAVRFRGREITHQEVGMELVNRIRQDTAEVAKCESEPRLEGRQIVMVLTPK